MADESTRIDGWLYATLAADSALAALVGGPGSPRIFSELAPSGSAFPLVLFTLQSSTDVVGATESTRIMIDAVYAVTAIAETGTWVGDLQDIADRIDAALHSSVGGIVDSTTVFTSHRIQGLRLLEERDGRQFRRLGGIYRIYAR